MKRILLSKLSLFLIVFSIFFFGLMCFTVEATTITVTTTEDNVEGSLRAAITIANNNAENDTIILPSGTYLLTGQYDEDNNQSGDLDINNNEQLTIQGEGKNSTIIDGNTIDRVFHIIAGTVTMSNLTITNGHTKNGIETDPDGGDGGGIYNDGELTLIDCNISANQCGNGYDGYFYVFYVKCPGWGGAGAGIYNNHILNLSKCTIDSNICGDCGGAIDACGEIPIGGDGGGIYNALNAIAVIDGCTISHNLTGNGFEGGEDHDISNSGGKGGGIFNAGDLTTTDCTFQYNQTGYGGFGTYSGGDGGRSGNGGGIYNSNKALINNCTIKDNHTGRQPVFRHVEGDGGGICNTGTMKLLYSIISKNYAGPSGNGGGIASLENSIDIQHSSICYNFTEDGVEDYDSAGHGGGIFNTASDFSMTNCTISGNFTGNGIYREGHNVTDGGNGGGIYLEGSEAKISNCTICDNHTGEGGKPDSGSGDLPGTPGYGGGIYSFSPQNNLKSSIVANNSIPENANGTDIFGFIYNEGYNLIENTDSLYLTNNWDLSIHDVEPLLAPLADNGCQRQTHALLPGSPAIDAGNASSLTIDQRGYPRTFNFPDIPNVSDGTDIGAYEADMSILGTPEIALSRNSLLFGADKAGNITPPQTVIINNSGTGTLNWIAESNASWLSCSPASGTGFSQLTVSASATGIQPGTYTGMISISDANAENSPQTIQVTMKVYNWGVISPPFGFVDTPISGSVARGSIPVTGWALDNVGIEHVKIYRDPISGEGSGLVYIGIAIFVDGARPDVQSSYPDYPESYKAGWGYMLLTNFLPGQGNGTFQLHVIAVDKEGNNVTLGKKTIVCDNAHAVKPFGAIDTPAAGGTVSGSSYVNFGWALTPQPNTIPIDGSTITVWIDGNPLGHPVYNNYRKDIATLFPDYNNSNGAVGYYYLDTTKYQNGVHTIAWSVKDDAGNGDGVGSRFFTIQNAGSSRVAGTGTGFSHSANLDSSLRTYMTEKSQLPKDYHSSVTVRTGFDLKSSFQETTPDENGLIAIPTRMLEPIEIRFNQLQAIQLLTPLPVGAGLDETENVFRWQPGLGFAGDHSLTFLVKDEAGNLYQKEFVIQIGQ
jgi:hypothetical protein